MLLKGRGEMSVRAYKVKKFEYDEMESFDMRGKLFEFLDATCDLSNGLIEVHVGILRDAIRMKDELGLDEGTVENIKRDIKEAEDGGSDYVRYYYF
jgi:hypothetical protein